MCLNCKPEPWTIADYEMAIKHATENVKPGDIIDGQMRIAVYQQIIDEKKGKRKTLKQLKETLNLINKIK